jgi:serine protease Do
MRVLRAAFSEPLMTRRAALPFANLLLSIAALSACSPRGDTPTPLPVGPKPEVSTSQVAPPIDVVNVASPAVTGIPNFTALVKKEGPAVVNVTATRGARAADSRRPDLSDDDPMAEFFRRFLPNPPDDGSRSRSQGLGSGFIISADGFILTNAHVVANADDVTVRLADAKRELKAKVVGVDAQTDVALLKVDAKDLPTVTLGKSVNVQVGEWVAAIGSPFGFANTITAGIVSATGRDLPAESFVPFIQTDVAVNPGNSGGPLLNLRGEVVGINSMIYSRTGGYMGVSFAIPIDVALNVSDQLRTQGRVTRGRLGVRIQEVTDEIAKSFALTTPRGVIVTAVERGGPADKAGIVAGDIITAYDGKSLERAVELPRLVAATKPGSTTRLTVWRKGKEENLTATVGEVPSEAVASNEAPRADAQPANAVGLLLSELPPAQLKELQIDYGLRVERVQGPAADTQIRRGDVIVAANSVSFTNRKEFEEVLTKSRASGVVALLVKRGEALLYIPVKLG